LLIFWNKMGSVMLWWICTLTNGFGFSGHVVVYFWCKMLFGWIICTLTVVCQFGWIVVYAIFWFGQIVLVLVIFWNRIDCVHFLEQDWFFGLDKLFCFWSFYVVIFWNRIDSNRYHLGHIYKTKVLVIIHLQN
jgi:hypothetical protein